MKRAIATLAPLVILLAACSQPVEDPAPSAAPAQEQVSEAPTEESATTDPTAACSPEPPSTTYGDAVAGVELPTGTVVQLVQDVAPHRDVDQSMADVIVYLCGQPLDEDTHRGIASDIAVALHSSPAGETVHKLVVESYADHGVGLDLERSLGVDDFQAYTWEDGGPRSLDTNWE